MRKIVPLLFLLLPLFGCQIGQIGRDPGAAVVLISSIGEIRPPTASDRPLYYQVMSPGQLTVLNFNPGRDQYGNSTGFSDSRYTLTEVVIQCSEKDVEDTIFTFLRERRPNEVIWFPAWTAPIEPISGLPIPYYPLPGYPWSYCRDAMGYQPPQTATITATARAGWVKVEFRLPEGPTYTLEGHLPTANNVFAVHLTEPGVYTVTYPGGEYELEVPVDWFLIRNVFEVEVAPVGDC